MALWRFINRCLNKFYKIQVGRGDESRSGDHALVGDRHSALAVRQRGAQRPRHVQPPPQDQRVHLTGIPAPGNPSPGRNPDPVARRPGRRGAVHRVPRPPEFRQSPRQ